MIILDGSAGEGGGAIVRVALALSALTGKEFLVKNIRANRPEPGLKAQHLEAIKALKEICKAETNEIKIGTTKLHFKPGAVKKGSYQIEIGTAGSITLVVQALMLPCLFGSGKITLKITGGTCGKGQASVDYLQNILLPHLKKFAEKIQLKILKRGYYPKGGGGVQLEISPKIKRKDFSSFEEFWQQLRERIPQINLTEQGKLEQIRGVVNCSRELEKGEVGERIKRSAEEELRKLNCPADIKVEYAESLSPGGEIVLWTVFSREGDVNPNNPIILGGEALAEKGKSSEEVGKEAALKLISEIKSEGCVDRHLSDQLLIFMALLPGSLIKASEITNHSLTNIEVIEKFLQVKFKIEGKRISVQATNT